MPKNAHYILTQIQKNRFPLSASGAENSSSFLKWGEKYYSFCEECFSFPSIIIHLPLTPINIAEYHFATNKDGIFPTNWTLSASLDNKNWIILDQKDEHMCNHSRHASSTDPKLYCYERQIRTFQVSNPENLFFHYFNFTMRGNSFINSPSNPWYYTLSGSGFDISGSYLIPYCVRTCHISTIHLISLFFLCFLL